MNKKLFLLIVLGMACNNEAVSDLTHTEELLLELYQNQRQDLKEYSLQMVESAKSIQLSSDRLDNLVQHLDSRLHKYYCYKTALYCILSAAAGAIVHKAFADYSAQKPDSWIGTMGNVFGFFNFIRKSPNTNEPAKAGVVGAKSTFKEAGAFEATPKN